MGTTGKARREEHAGSRKRRGKGEGGEEKVGRWEYSVAARIGGRPVVGTEKCLEKIFKKKEL